MKRNTPNERMCAHCYGAGVIEVRPHVAASPYDYDVPCGECKGEGWIRWRDRDPLEVMRSTRRAWPLAYTQARRDAMRPVASRLRQADMLAWAARCVTAGAQLSQTVRAAA